MPSFPNIKLHHNLKSAYHEYCHHLYTAHTANIFHLAHTVNPIHTTCTAHAVQPTHTTCTAHTVHPACKTIGEAQPDLNNRLQLLWEQHVYWTRLTIGSIVFGLPDLDFVINRLLRNPKDFALLLEPLYGDETASMFADLFTAHLVITAQLVMAAKAGDREEAVNIEKEWYANADEIATLLAGINPFWSEPEWKEMLHKHLALTTVEAGKMLNQKYGESIMVFDQIEIQALEMVDVMRDGIIKQFPDKFMG
jgi:hypothetical protein